MELDGASSRCQNGFHVASPVYAACHAIPLATAAAVAITRRVELASSRLLPETAAAGSPRAPHIVMSPLACLLSAGQARCLNPWLHFAPARHRNNQAKIDVTVAEGIYARPWADVEPRPRAESDCRNDSGCARMPDRHLRKQPGGQRRVTRYRPAFVLPRHPILSERSPAIVDVP